MDCSKIPAYSQVKCEEIEELKAKGTLLYHKKTGARICCVECEDDNKVFYISFCTPPKNDTGVAHIIEHSVLCGSEKYPAKDPFAELARGSLNTYLNALTYPDKTVYPVASCNDEDFKNLMSVYMDSVLHPNIYSEPKIFQQEGWHYEMKSEEDELTFNGVVYNEMKGAFSTPDDVLDRYTKCALFPDTVYGCESGGNPKNIPELSREEFLEFHRTYYHPSNSYIYLYGNMDMEERLRWLDEEYLSGYEKLDFDGSSLIGVQEPFDRIRDEEIYYGVTDEEEEEESVFLSWSKVVGSFEDKKLDYAMQILDYVLLGAPGAILREALVKKGIGVDIYGGYENGLRQTFFSVVAKGCEADQKEEFIRTIEETLKELADTGISKKTLKAAISTYEFRSREQDFGHYPKGLAVGLNALDTWLYDDMTAFDRMHYNDVYAFLHEAVETDYFERLIRERLLETSHGVTISACPQMGLTEKQDAELAAALAKKKAGMSPEEIRAIVEETGALKLYQETPSKAEDLDTIPMIHVSDIRREAMELPYRVVKKTNEYGGYDIVESELFTSGITYVSIAFDANNIPDIVTNRNGERDLEYAYGVFSLFELFFGQLNTKNYTYEDLDDEVNLRTGGMDPHMDSFSDVNDPNSDIDIRFVMAFKTLTPNLADSMKLAAEYYLNVDFDNPERIREIIGRNMSQMEEILVSRGHSTALGRARSYFGMSSYLADLTTGISFYQFEKKILEDFDECSAKLIDDLKKISASVFTPKGMTAGVTASDAAALEDFEQSLQWLISELNPQENHEFVRGNGIREAEKTIKNEGFATASMVNFVAQCGDFTKDGFTYHGSMRVLSNILDYGYLWTKLRVQGGAYGCMNGFGLMGGTYFVTYRDPEIKKTLEIFDSLPEYLESFDADEKEMEKNIIGAIAIADTPKSPSAKGNMAFSEYLSNDSRQNRQRRRNQILDTTKEDIRALAPVVRAVLDQKCFCCVGNAGKIEKESDVFGEVRSLFG